jgi:methionine aminotransferase
MITQNIEHLSSPSDIVAYAKETGIINMAENFSALECNNELEQLLQTNMVPYANMPSPKFGLYELREAISAKVAKYYDHSYNPEHEISVTSGIKQALFATMMALLKEGDEVIIIEPAHKSYEAAINITGARVVYIELKAPEFLMNWEDVQKLINPKTRMIIINNPHFPTGTSLSELDMLRLQKIISGTNILILSDESFEHTVFDKEMHQSMALYPKLRERSIIISSFDETFNIRNWHVGYCLSTQKLMKEIRKVMSIMGEGITVPYQKTLAKYMSTQPDYNLLAPIYQHKRDLFIHALEDSHIKAIPSKASYFQLISRSEKSEETDINFASMLIKKKELATVPVGYYYHQKTNSRYLRLNLSVPDDVILEVAKRLKEM